MHVLSFPLFLTARPENRSAPQAQKPTTWFGNHLKTTSNDIVPNVDPVAEPEFDFKPYPKHFGLKPNDKKERQANIKFIENSLKTTQAWLDYLEHHPSIAEYTDFNGNPRIIIPDKLDIIFYHFRDEHDLVIRGANTRKITAECYFSTNSHKNMVGVNVTNVTQKEGYLSQASELIKQFNRIYINLPNTK